MTDILTLLGSLLVAVVLVRGIIPVILKVSRLKNLYDEPSERRVGHSMVPSLGGVAIFIGFTLSTILASHQYLFEELQYILGASIILFFIGLKDDILVISPKLKLCAQLIAAFLVVLFANIRFTHLHGLLGIESISLLPGLIISVVVIVAIINAFNLIDGIDGLAAGTGIIGALTFGGWFVLAQHWEYAILAFSLAGSLGVFFYYNVFSRTNKIFMGDTGSLLIGLIFAILVIKFNELNIQQEGAYAINSAPAVSFGILIIPLFDTLRIVFLRLFKKQNPFHPDTNHVHHRLLNLNYSHFQASLRIFMCNIFFIAINFLLQEVGIIFLLFINIALGIFFSMIPGYLIYKKEHMNADKLLQQFVLEQLKNLKNQQEEFGKPNIQKQEDDQPVEEEV